MTTQSEKVLEIKEKRRRKRKIRFCMIPITIYVVMTFMYEKNEYIEYRETITYTVKEGDTLWGISKIYLGKGYKYVQIACENKTDHPDLIYPGENYNVTVTHRVKRK